MKTLLTALLERAMMRYIQLDPETSERLGKLAGKVVKLELMGWNAAFYLFPGKGELRMQNGYEGPVDATITGSPISLLRLSVLPEEKLSRVANEVEITGDVEVAHALSRMLKQIQIDWEEPLSHVVGDTLAHQIGYALERGKRWGLSTFENMRQNMTDYLQEEGRYLPTKREVEDFCEDVCVLRNDVDRIEHIMKMQGQFSAQD